MWEKDTCPKKRVVEVSRCNVLMNRHRDRSNRQNGECERALEDDDERR